MIRENAGISGHQKAAVGWELETVGIFADVFTFQANDEDVIRVFCLCFGDFSLHQSEVDRHDFRRLVLIRRFGFFFSSGEEGKVEAAQASDDDWVGVRVGEGGRIEKFHARGGRINL